jgi:methionyl aminopeptidase
MSQRLREPLTPGRVSSMRSVPSAIARPEYVGRPGPETYTGPEVKDPDTIAAMRVAGRIAADAMAEVGRAVVPGVTTDELDRIGHEYLCDHGAYPSTLGYRGFPKSLCTSLNEVICHGIPDTTQLQDGDICNIDITAYIGGVTGTPTRPSCAATSHRRFAIWSTAPRRPRVGRSTPSRQVDPSTSSVA